MLERLGMRDAAKVAAVGQILTLGLAMPAHAATPPDIVFYGRAGNDASMRYTQWSGSSWSASAPGTNVTQTPSWVRMAGCPTRAESVILTLSSTRVARVYHHIGIYCYPETQVTSSVGGSVGRPADVTYEQSSSDALVVYWVNSANKVGWRTSINGTLSSESQLTLPATSTATYLSLVPLSGSDQILLLALNSDKRLYACFWSGSAWGAVTTISTDMSIADTECFAAAFERTSGDGLLVYSPGSTSNLKYRVWTGGAWGAEQNGPSVGNTYDWVRLAANPSQGSNSIVMGLLDHNKGVQVGFWNGSSWGTLTTCTSDAETSDTRRFDVAYSPTGANALVVYAKSGQSRPYSRYWTGTTWAVESAGPNTGESALFVQLVPEDSGNDIHVVWSDSGLDLHAALWSGGSIGAATVIDSALSGSSTTEPFDVIIPGSGAGSLRRITGWHETAAVP